MLEGRNDLKALLTNDLEGGTVFLADFNWEILKEESSSTQINLDRVLVELRMKLFNKETAENKEITCRMSKSEFEVRG